MTVHPPTAHTPGTSPPVHRAPGLRAALSPSAGLWVVTTAFTALMAFGTVPTPLRPLYQAHDHFGPTGVTLAFAYLGMGLPSVAFSLLIQHTPLRTTMIGFAAVLSAGTIAAVVTAIRANRRP
ncbi:hypothetical protein GCM10018793_64060 [Streptomyces sulfonofaciens]|uniref:MFS transporter n=1 Tax=Streptomyces sulfonofaciens TaxID=68272 RepID=A0A919GP29_9ACTN|nr:hypothetical protein [Streptomyces sulfonofaciens]GHH87618.1 hypothetical protein GCM10018793_64060 [Streptomyces sulfonofaciens]